MFFCSYVFILLPGEIMKKWANEAIKKNFRHKYMPVFLIKPDAL